MGTKQIKEYDQFVREGLIKISKGHAGRHWVTCSLLSTLDHNRALAPNVHLTPSLIHKTYVTLRKHFGWAPGEMHKWIKNRDQTKSTYFRELKPPRQSAPSRTPKSPTKRKR